MRQRLGYVRQKAKLDHGNERVRRAPARGASDTVGQQPTLVTGITAPVVQRRFADAFFGSQGGECGRWCSGRILRSTASLR